MVSTKRHKASGHKANEAKYQQRIRWNYRHPEGRKIYSLKNRIKSHRIAIEAMQRKIKRLKPDSVIVAELIK